MKTTYTILLFFICYLLTGQDDSTMFRKNQLKISPVRLFGTDRGIELNYERQVTSRFSMQITGRYITDIFKNTSLQSYHHLTGIAVYLEPKYYFNDWKKWRVFFSAGLGYSHSTFETIDEFINVQADTLNKLEYYFNDTVNVDRKFLDFTINCGIQKCYKNFVFEFSAGIGLRYREVKLSNKLYEDQKMWKGLHEFFIPPHGEGNFFTLNLPVKLKIGYCF